MTRILCLLLLVVGPGWACEARERIAKKQKSSKTADMAPVRGIPVDLPQAATGQELSQVTAVAIDAQGRLFLDGARATPDSLEQQLRQWRRENPKLEVVIHADRQTTHQRVVEVLDRCRKAGITRYAIAVTPPALRPVMAPLAAPPRPRVALPRPRRVRP